MAKRPLDEVEEFVEVGDVTHPAAICSVSCGRTALH